MRPARSGLVLHLQQLVGGFVVRAAERLVFGRAEECRVERDDAVTLPLLEFLAMKHVDVGMVAPGWAENMRPRVEKHAALKPFRIERAPWKHTASVCGRCGRGRLSTAVESHTLTPAMRQTVLGRMVVAPYSAMRHSQPWRAP